MYVRDVALELRILPLGENPGSQGHYVVPGAAPNLGRCVGKFTQTETLCWKQRPTPNVVLGAVPNPERCVGNFAQPGTLCWEQCPT